MKKIENNDMKVYTSEYGQYPSTYDKYTSAISTSKILLIKLNDDCESAEFIDEMSAYYKSNICQRVKSFSNTESVTVRIKLPDGCGKSSYGYENIKSIKLTPQHLRILKQDMIKLINSNYTKSYSYLIKHELLQVKEYLTNITRLCTLVEDNPDYVIIYTEL